MARSSEFDWKRLPSEAVRAFARALIGVGAINDAAALATLRNRVPVPDAAFLARRLTEIACHMPLEILHTDLVRRAPDVASLTEFFDRHNFGPLLRRQAERLALLRPAAAA
jgi:hypothetical protein